MADTKVKNNPAPQLKLDKQGPNQTTDPGLSIKRTAKQATTLAGKARAAELVGSDNRALELWTSARRSALNTIKKIKSLPANEQAARAGLLEQMQELENEEAANMTRLKQEGAVARPPKPNPFEPRQLPSGDKVEGKPAPAPTPPPTRPQQGPF
jgi:hypothetical protein